MKIDIKNCPFCNGPAEIREHKRYDDLINYYDIMCNICFVVMTGFMKTEEFSDKSRNAIQSRNELIGRWNERV